MTDFAGLQKTPRVVDFYDKNGKLLEQISNWSNWSKNPKKQKPRLYKIMILEFSRNELVSEPEERNLNFNRSIVVFNISTSDKTGNLNTGNKFNYENETYEVMNREPVDSGIKYIKFNCVRKVADNS